MCDLLEVEKVIESYGYNGRKFIIDRWNENNKNLIMHHMGYFGLKIDKLYKLMRKINNEVNVKDLQLDDYIDLKNSWSQLNIDISNYLGVEIDKLHYK